MHPIWCRGCAGQSRHRAGQSKEAALSLSVKGGSLLATSELSVLEVEQLLDSAQEYRDGGFPDAPYRDRVVALAFFEPSTRTRSSFELAARKLGAGLLDVSSATSSMRKGESLRDTVMTLETLGADLVALRHPASGAATACASWLQIPVINAGDGAHDHPTQALVDALTLRQHFGRIAGLRIVVVGDILRGRGAHAWATLLPSLGATVTLVGPRSLLPIDPDAWDANISDDLDDSLGECDAVLIQRVQFERYGEMYMSSSEDFARRYAMTLARLRRLPDHAMVLHPGPMNRGIEVASAVADSSRSLVLSEVANGVVVRAAVINAALRA
jgi:aspartate carbamoyltransferase catalytic subunit